jgi:hypothetical protein
VPPVRVGVVVRQTLRDPLSELDKALPWFAADKPDVFNAYQQTQSERVERAMAGAKYVASFIGREAGKALFIGAVCDRNVEADYPRRTNRAIYSSSGGRVTHGYVKMLSQSN